MATPRTPRTMWIDEGLKALAAGGPDAVRIESLAKALGVTKGGFYGYFDHRQALIDEMLEEWERAMIDEAIERAESERAQARAKLRRLFRLAGPRQIRGLGQVGRAVRDGRRRNQVIAKQPRRVTNLRMDYVRVLFRDL